MVEEKFLDILIVGAGFSGLHTLQKLRKEGFQVNIYEAGSGIGGTWYWNRYPGARVDSDFSIYQYTQDNIWKDFEWTERFPGQQEIERYFKHVDNKLNLSKDIQFNTRVISAEFKRSRNKWLVKTNASDEVLTWANTLILCTGFADKRYTPPFRGVDSFKGTICHTSLWPKSGINVRGKRVAVIGTGASGVQVIQEIASEVAHLTVYQRTPNLALPMQQSLVEDQRNWKFPSTDEYQSIFNKTRTTFAGMTMDFIPTNGVDATPDEQQVLFQDLFKRGGFYFWLANYKDLLFSEATNDAAYQFWCEATRTRINDPVKKDILAPKVPPHPFGTKRPSLEQRYYEVFNQDNVDIINVRQSPIVEIVGDGIKTQIEGKTQVDVIIFATGFDAVTGGILNIQITNEENESLQDKWKNSVWTSLGVTTAGFPNMFFMYGPQAPTAFANGPSCAEVQGDWIIKLLTKMKRENKTKVVALEEAEHNWKQTITDLWNKSLFPRAESWYQGANIPGKPREPLNFAGGIPLYISALEDCAKNNYQGFLFS